MVHSCCALNCTERWKKDGVLSFHRFPENEEILKKWLTAIRRHNFKPTKYSRICSKHFERVCYDVSPWSSKKNLKSDAVPTVFDYPSPILCNAEEGTSCSRDTVATHTEEHVAERKEISVVRCVTNEIMRHPKKRKSFVGDIENADISVDITSNLMNEPSTHSGEHLTELIVAPGNHCVTKEVRPKHKRRKSYMGDVDESYLSQKEKVLMNTFKAVLLKKRKVIRTLQQKNRRLVSRITSLENTLLECQKKNTNGEDLAKELLESTPNSAKALLTRMLTPKGNRHYHPDLRSFALTLNFYSPKAYNYVRKTLIKALPHPRTLQKWFESVSGEPESGKESMDASYSDKGDQVLGVVYMCSNEELNNNPP